jgi:chitodextrinase
LSFHRYIGVLVTGIVLSCALSANASGDPVVYSAGDIACAPGDSTTSTKCRERYTSDVVVSGGAARALALGDLQYNSASLSNLQNSYNKTWGRFKSITRPALGNHEGGGGGYFDYWNGSGVNDGPAGPRGKGWYSFDVGGWHLIALNSNCSNVGCAAGSAQESWLKSDLAAHPTACALAFWHHPRFSSGHDGNNTFMQDLWKDLYNARVDLALVGHSHDYERFAPLNGSGQLDRSNGIRQFVVGTGGAFFTGWTTTQPNSEVRQNSTYGVLKVTLHPTSYDWKFVPEAGKTFTDSGSEACRGGGSPAGDTQAPSTPANLTATASSSTSVGLNWNASTDNVAVAGYEVFRGGSLLTTVTGTGYSDNSVSPGNSYSYQVRSFDAAGNRSGFSNTASATTPASGGGTTLTFTPIDDASIYADTPSTNLGSATTLETDGSPVKDFLIKFAVNGLEAKQVTSVKLRLYCVNASAGSGGEFRDTTSTWSQALVNWNTAPAAGGVVASLGPVSASRWYEVPVTSLVTGDGIYSLRVRSTSSDGADYSSSEGSSSLVPQLVVTAN